MTHHEVRVATRDELEGWLRSNIQPHQKETGTIDVVCPDRAAKDSGMVSELRARGWKLYIREWDYDSEDDPRAMVYWLGCQITSVMGCLELVMEESETFAKDKRLQIALRNARSVYEWGEKLKKKLY